MATITTIENLSRSKKRFILFSINLGLIAFSLIMGFALRFGMVFPIDPIRAHWALFPAMLSLGALTIWALRLHHIKIHTIENNALMRLAIASGFLSLCAMAASFLLTLSAPRSVPMIFGAVFFMSSVVFHFGARYVFDRISDQKIQRVPVAIYGAGNTGEQLAAALGQNGENRPVCFIDDNRQLHGLMVAGLKVHPVNALRRLIKKHGLKRVLVAMPSTYRRHDILEALSALPIEVIDLPNVSDQVGNRALERGLQAKRFKDLYHPQNPKARAPEVLAACRDKTILITGAGGDIGSELAQQLVRFEPRSIILLERNETALLKTLLNLRTLTKRTGSDIRIIARTGSVAAADDIRRLLRSENVQIIINAAHYSTPQLAEDNLIETVRSNVMGPVTLTQAALEHGVEQLVLLTAEGVTAPRHLIDRTQRLAEQLVLGIAAQTTNTRATNAQATGTQISLLRFGPTAGPVGDILPLLEQQVLTHNAVTLPDPEMTRFFMTKSRAADLILSALPHAEKLHGTPVHLSKGAPRKIMDFVHRVIDLSGKGVRSETNPFGIEIRFCGLRPGEELHEACQCSDHCTPLEANPDLLLATPPKAAPIAETAALLDRVTTALGHYDDTRLRQLLTPQDTSAAKGDADLAILKSA